VKNVFSNEENQGADIVNV